MVRWMGLALLLAAGGCAALADDGLNGPGPAGPYDFDWQLSGDAAVAPLQVFATPAQVWLQFGAGQEVPAIFAGTGQGDRLVAWRRQGPYVVIDGAWRALTMRGGRYVARAARAGAMGAAGQGGTPWAAAGALPMESGPSAVAPALPAGAGLPGGIAGSAHPLAPAPLPDTPARAAMASPPGAAPPASGQGLPAAASRATSAAAFHAGPPDATLRSVLSKWAGSAGWTFQSQHWAVSVDIPLAGSAEFGTDFKQAVRALLGATELTDRPVQPCFYTNRVLRVVPYTQACDPSAASMGVPS
ncbi:lipoprotein [Bordetella ansorpii]|uniref:Lipoprotein n=1 Tax=Bordetella ansorpii TaxID=288768 RepID=A0A157SQE0_9BORD|nr:TcpQ domain-containing protein [Bordetella ansorpii]SAI72116.1 lipoprotein [Bordetella ansorpii]